MYDGFYDINEARKYEEKVLDLDRDSIIGKADLAETLLAFGEYEKSSNLASEVLKIGSTRLGYPMRLIIVCSLYFRKCIEECTKAALDLVEYYKTIPDNTTIIWKFLGLRKTVANNKEITADVHSLLNSFIDLVENPDVYNKNRSLKTLPELIRSVDANMRIVTRTLHPEKELNPTPQEEIKVKNTSEPDKLRKGWYNWEIFLTPKEALQNVKKVVYTLHETFPNRIKEVKDLDSGFKLKNKGWGEFQVKVEIYFEGIKTPLVKYHWLKLSSQKSTA